jgi:hypothetical protein
MEITKEQVLELYNSSNNGLLKKWFPEAFGLEVGKWYKYNDSNIIFNFQGKYSTAYKSGAYGFANDGNWYENLGVDSNSEFMEPYNEEVMSILIKEAKKRGYKNGNYKCLSEVKTHDVQDFFTYENNVIYQGIGLRNIVYIEGKWADVIETISKEEAERILNKKIL